MLGNVKERTRLVPVYATTGPASWALAYELAAFLVDYKGSAPEPANGTHDGAGADEASPGPLRVVLVDTLGRVDGGSGGESPPDGGIPALLRDERRRISVLARPDEGGGNGASGGTGDAAEVGEMVRRLGTGFDAVVVCCGSSAYGRRWLLGADGVAVCGAPGEELRGVVEDTTAAFVATAPEGENRQPAVVLAPIGGPDTETGDGHPAYLLPRARESADFRPALGPLLEGLFEATGRRPSAAGVTGDAGAEPPAPPSGRGREDRRTTDPAAVTHAAHEAGEPSGGGSGEKASSTEALEARLRASLRETTVGGFSRV